MGALRSDIRGVLRTSSRLLIGWLALVAVIGLMARPGVAQTQGEGCLDSRKLESTIDTVEGFYVRRQYPQVVELLEPIAGNDLCLESEKERVEAHLLLGVAYHQTAELGLAEMEFLALLRIQPDYSLDGVIPVPAAAAAYMEETRLKHEEELNEIRIQMGGGKDVVVETLFVTFEDQRNQFWINFLPFGAGQFQNEQLAWGAAFATAEVLALSANFLGWGMVEVLRQGKGDFAPSKVTQARAWDTVKLVGGWSFAALYVAGTVHAMLTFEETRRLRMLPPTREMPEAALEPATPWLIGPIVTGEGMGLGLLVGF